MINFNLKKNGIFIKSFIILMMIYFLYREIFSTSIFRINSFLSDVSVHQIFLAVFLGIINYFIITGYELMAIKSMNIKIEKEKLFIFSFLYSIFKNIFSSSEQDFTNVKINFYSLWGIKYKDILKVSKNRYFISTAVFLLLGGLSQILYPSNLKKFDIFIETTFPLGIIAILVGMFLILYFLMKNEFSLKETSVQFFLGIAEWFLMGNIIYIFVPDGINFGLFFSIFMCAKIFGTLSTVPEGFGVFDVIFIKLLGSYYPKEIVIGIVIIYRILCCFLPLFTAGICLIFYKVTLKNRFKGTVILNTIISKIGVEFLAFLVFVSGTLLLFSGALPQNFSSFKGVNIFYENVIIISHFLASITGTFLLILAYGIKKRLDAAYFFTVISVSLGSIFIIFKGTHYKFLYVLLLTLIFMLFSRDKFYRKSSIINEEINIKWILSGFIVLIFSIVLGLYTFKNVKYSDELWWQFTLNSTAPMFMRASLASVIAFIIFFILKMFRPVIQLDKISSNKVYGELKEILKYSEWTNSNLSFLDDKYIYMNEEKTVFIMYGISNKKVVVMGDPVGREEDISDTLWDFYNIVQRSGYNIVFYEINKNFINYYLDIGLKFFKIGEEAIVNLKNFTLEGSSQKKLRYVYSKNNKIGVTFEIVNFEENREKLKEISDEWLKNKKGSEKEFSLGKFDDKYLKNFKIAVLKFNGEIVAFANLWETYTKKELSIDLMRYSSKAPNDSMEYLFICIMLWGKENGFESFSLGMAPLSGLDYKGTASLWNKFGAFIFKNGGNFYNFLGLKNFKNKFNPEWRPKYIALSGNFNLPSALNSIATLVSGGIKGLTSK